MNRRRNPNTPPTPDTAWDETAEVMTSVITLAGIFILIAVLWAAGAALI